MNDLITKRFCCFLSMYAIYLSLNGFWNDQDKGITRLDKVLSWAVQFHKSDKFSGLGLSLARWETTSKTYYCTHKLSKLFNMNLLVQSNWIRTSNNKKVDNSMVLSHFRNTSSRISFVAKIKKFEKSKKKINKLTNSKW